MELYDGDGYLIEINSVGLKMMGVKDKQDMLGINIFEKDVYKRQPLIYSCPPLCCWDAYPLATLPPGNLKLWKQTMEA